MAGTPAETVELMEVQLTPKAESAQLVQTNSTASAAGKEGIKDSNTWDVARAVVAILCAVMGSGIVGLPYAIADMGVTGVILLAISPLLLLWTALKLLEVDLHYPGHCRYPAMAELLFGKKMMIITVTCQICSNFGVATLYIVLAADNIFQMGGALTVDMWIVILAIIMSPFFLIRHMKEISALALLGVVATLLVIITVVVGDFEIYNKQLEELNYGLTRVNVFGYFNGLGVIVFAYGGHAVYPSIVAEYPNPYKTGKAAFAIAYPLICVCYLLFCATNYFILGCHVTSSILDDPLFPHNTAYLVAVSCITCHVLVATILFTNGTMFFLETKIGIEVESFWSRGQLKSAAFRIGLLLIFVILGTSIPSFGDLLNVLSGFNILLCIPFPLMFWLEATNPQRAAQRELNTTDETNPEKVALKNGTDSPRSDPESPREEVTPRAEGSSPLKNKPKEMSSGQKAERYLAGFFIVVGIAFALFVTVSAIVTIVNRVTTPGSENAFPLCYYEGPVNSTYGSPKGQMSGP